MPDFINLHKTIEEDQLHFPKDFTTAPVSSVPYNKPGLVYEWAKPAWLFPILNIVNATLVPPTEVDGDRYYIKDLTGTAVNAEWDGVSIETIAEFRITGTVSAWFEESLVLADRVDNKDDTTVYRFDGTTLISKDIEATSFDQLSDGKITSATPGDTIRFDGTNFINNNFLFNNGSFIGINKQAPVGTEKLRIGGDELLEGTIQFKSTIQKTIINELDIGFKITVNVDAVNDIVFSTDPVGFTKGLLYIDDTEFFAQGGGGINFIVIRDGNNPNAIQFNDGAKRHLFTQASTFVEFSFDDLGQQSKFRLTDTEIILAHNNLAGTKSRLVLADSLLTLVFDENGGNNRLLIDATNIRFASGTVGGDLFQLQITALANDDTSASLRYKPGAGAEVINKQTVGAVDSGGTGFRLLRVPN